MDDNKQGVYSKVIRAGRRRTYFFDVRTTKGNDYYVTITESKKRFNDDGYDRHKIFLYKEDFNKFMEAMNNTIDHVKNDLLPEYDFDEFSNNYDEDYEGGGERKEYKKEDTSFDTLETEISKTPDTAETTAEEMETPTTSEEVEEPEPPSEEELKW